LKSCCVLQDHYDNERHKIVFHKITLDLQDQDQDQFFLVSDRSCPKTDGLRPHHCEYPIPRGTPSPGVQNTRGWIICDFQLKSPSISETVRD